MNKIVIGIPSGDHECFCFDVPKDEFVKIEGELPDEYYGLCFYEGLYRIYGIPDVSIFGIGGIYHNPKVLLEVEYP